ncbi:MAG: UDP-N-acetylmuramoyl-tripeptide--D-alanyl-D-alanine ligase [Akkermansiaceae bacterium]
MKALSIQEIVTSTGGELVGHDHGQLVRAVSTDTRSIPKSCLFIALSGENFDGHDFLEAAVLGGAACLLLHQLPEAKVDVPVILVKDTLIALQRLAKWYRDQLDIKVIGITGSNGKTSTKDFTASVIAQKFRVNATKGNFNNHIGLPLSVLNTEETDEVCILEMGMNHAGEIAPLCQIASPDIGVITNVGTAHIEFLGSRENIAAEKSELGRSLSSNGTLIVPASCDFVNYMIDHTTAKIIVTGNGRGLVRAENLRQTDSGSAFDLCLNDQAAVPVEIAVSGVHMINNALLAAAAGYALGMNAQEIAAGLNQASLTSGRLRRYSSKGVQVIDDTYNANPDSVIAAINTLKGLQTEPAGKKIIILGAMAELGEYTESEHLRVGRVAAEKQLQVVSVGEQARQIFQGAQEISSLAKHFDQQADASHWLSENVGEGDFVLFKGSRTAGMEKVMNSAFPQD